MESLTKLAVTDPEGFLRKLHRLPYSPELDKFVATAARASEVPLSELAKLLNGLSAQVWRETAWKAAVEDRSATLATRDAIALAELANIHYPASLYDFAFEHAVPDDLDWLLERGNEESLEAPILESLLRKLMIKSPDLAMEAFSRIPETMGHSTMVKYRFLSDYITASANKGEALRDTFSSVSDFSGSLEWKANYVAVATGAGDPTALATVIELVSDLPPPKRDRLLSSVRIENYTRDELDHVLLMMSSNEAKGHLTSTWSARNK